MFFRAVFVGKFILDVVVDVSIKVLKVKYLLKICHFVKIQSKKVFNEQKYIVEN